MLTQNSKKMKFMCMALDVDQGGNIWLNGIPKIHHIVEDKGKQKGFMHIRIVSHHEDLRIPKNMCSFLIAHTCSHL